MLSFLIVDDIFALRSNLRRVIEDLGHKVIAEAENGYEAIEQYKKYKPDIITLDITMPPYNGINDGIETLQEIKKINPDVKVLMVTSQSEQRQILKAITLGAKGYILKPVTEEKVISAINKMK